MSVFGLEGSFSILHLIAPTYLVAWIHLVEKKKTISRAGFEKLPASDKLRRLLSLLDIPLGLPPKSLSEQPPESTFEANLKKLKPVFPEQSSLLPDLVKMSATEKWEDGPHAFTDFRNSIVHPKKLKKVLDAPGNATREISDLGIQYLELIFLRLFGYEGRYVNRLIKPNYGETEPVPWNQ